MDMKQLNVFRRLNELETANLHLQVLLQGARRDIAALKKATKEQTQWLTSLQSLVTPKPEVKAEPKTKTLTKVQAEAVRAVSSKHHWENEITWPFPTELPPNRPIPPMPFNPANHEESPL